MDDLIKKARNGDPDAFTTLMRSQMQNMYATARAILRNEEDAADAISDTILVCWEKIESLRAPKYFRTWMTRILINKCNDILRKKKNLCFMEQIPDIETTDEGFQTAEWDQILQSLDEKYRLVIILYYVNGFRTSEISRMLNIPDSTVRTHLSRARSLLADNYSKEPKRSRTHITPNPLLGKERSI